MREQTIKAAEHFGILELLQKFEAALLKVEYVADVDFDVDNFGEIPQVIVIPHYDVPVSAPNYFGLRQNTLSNILIVCAQFDLWPSGDAIEDMGEHWYIVRSAGKKWTNVKKRKNAKKNGEPETEETPVEPKETGAEI